MVSRLRWSAINVWRRAETSRPHRWQPLRRFRPNWVNPMFGDAIALYQFSGVTTLGRISSDFRGFDLGGINIQLMN